MATPLTPARQRRAARDESRARRAFLPDERFDPDGAAGDAWRDGGTWSGWLDRRVGRRAPADLSGRLVEDLRFCRTVLGVVAPGKAREVRWATEADMAVGYLNAANSRTGLVILDPTPLKDPALSPAEARDVGVGNAIHEGAELAYTPPDWAGAVAACLTAEGFAHTDLATVVGLANIVNDRRIEAKALDRYPGYRGYLAACWRYDLPDSTLIERIAEARRQWHGGTAIALIVALGASYEPPSDEARAAYKRLHPRFRRVVERGVRLLRAAGQPGHTFADIVPLAYRLARLLRDGVPPEPGARDRRTGAPGLGGAEAVVRVTVSGGLPLPLPVNAGGDRPRAALDAAQAAHVARLEREEWSRDTATLPPPPPPAPADGRPWLDPDWWSRPLARISAYRPGEGEGRAMHAEWTTPRITTEAAWRYAADLAAVAGDAARLAATLQLRTEDRVHWRGGFTAGRLDGARLADLATYRDDPNPAPLFARLTVASAPRVGLALLVDESFSMHGRKQDAARRGAVLIDAALRALRDAGGGDGVEWAIRGHMGDVTDGRLRWDGDPSLALHRLVDGDRDDPRRLGALTAAGSTYDGPATQLILREAEARWPDRRRLLIILCDGLPEGRGYGGAPALAQQARQVAAARATGTGVVAIFVGAADARQEAQLRAMYGDGALIVPDPAALAEDLGAVVARQLAWEG